MQKVDAVRRLGLGNVSAVASYRLQLRMGIHSVQQVERKLSGTNFFSAVAARPGLPQVARHWKSEALRFGWHTELLNGQPPDWHRNPFTGNRIAQTNVPWWQLPDFSTEVGDIKTVWEASRFDWILPMAQRVCSGEGAARARLNTWLADWCENNPAYLGPNWKCGQEASIRVIHLAVAAHWLGQDGAQIAGDLRSLVEVHLARIAPSLQYAMAQDNNHGTSEAAALFIGGTWCSQAGVHAGNGWAKAGRRWLEERVAALVDVTGSFSQHSVNYHRLMLDTLSVAELWRRWHRLPQFSQTFYERARAATRWLFEMTEPATGAVPNLGANDGANLLPVTDADYRDYRPSVQFAANLFCDAAAFASSGVVGQHLAWFGLSTEVDAAKPALQRSKTGYHAAGYMVVSSGPWKAVFRYPLDRFRPGDCDALHVDLWHGSENLLRDCGSYSYNAGAEVTNYFTGPAGANTVQFDDRDPMPRVGPFLRAHWLRAQSLVPPRADGEAFVASASYIDWRGAFHERELRLAPGGLMVLDQLSGFAERAVLRWHLAPNGMDDENQCSWELLADGARCGPWRLRIHSDVPITRIEIVQGWESLYYFKKSELPVLEIEVKQPGRLVSEFGKAHP